VAGNVVAVGGSMLMDGAGVAGTAGVLSACAACTRDSGVADWPSAGVAGGTVWRRTTYASGGESPGDELGGMVSGVWQLVVAGLAVVAVSAVLAFLFLRLVWLPGVAGVGAGSCRLAARAKAAPWRLAPWRVPRAVN
jgi:hypothetical protein